ncbi:PTS fructose transporter subunit IIC [Clostridium sp. 'White wine YQ']|uniref:PTS fructose transporter subunit IIC n=1 Tax=Clostridium sp. 'White wine YQ' TaxID=3027474 RepID=UPI0023667F85|nr:fructose-specific PTS transporter subunit EIIC [Clostridium sp. 'White wine YQ']MDD7796290.1 fructose-specific PTS transporter subunit EIIC [Clostridium sp. 'White wine YQ']
MKLVAITSCPTGIAHTYMAAEALQMAAKELGYEIKVETQGSVGAENVITNDDLREARAVIIAADTNVDKSRFVGLPLIEVPVKDAIKDSKALIKRALNTKVSENLSSKVNKIKAEEKESRTGVYKHLMTGVSFMLPFVVAGGLLIALGFAFGGIYVYDSPNSIGGAIFWTGKASFALMIPALAGYIAYSIADRPGLVPGMVGGFLAQNVAGYEFLNTKVSSFLGAIIAGFIAGYVVLFLKKYIKLPKSMEGLIPILVLPLLSTLIVGLIMLFIVGGPVAYVNDSLAWWLNGLKGTNAALLGIILGLMMAFDLGGPVNKAAYTFATATLVAGKLSTIMAATMVAGMVPPLGIALATVIAKKKFTDAERESGKAAWALGLSFISEGAIPFAAADPLRVIPSVMAGGAVAGGLSMAFGCGLAVPHGGIWVLAIPNVVSNLLPYVVALVAGTVVTAIILSIIKKPVA